MIVQNLLFIVIGVFVETLGITTWKGAEFYFLDKELLALNSFLFNFNDGLATKTK